jgi:hypothetical protein
MVGGFLILIMIVFVLEDNMQPDVPVTNVNVTFVLLYPSSGGEKDDAWMFTQVFVAVSDELCLGDIGIIIEGKVDIVD